MVEKIVKLLGEGLNVTLDATDIAAMKTNIETTFTNLSHSEESGFASYSKTDTNTSWQYRIVFAFPNPDLPTYFYSLVTTIELAADIQEKSGWFGITGSSKKNFSAKIDAMQLVVNKEFR